MDNEKEISFGAFDSELMHQEIFIPEGFEATIDGNKIILTRIENEDEKIRKLLVEAVIQVLQDQYCSNRGVSKEKVVAWLEKQNNSFIKWNKNTKDNKPQFNHSVLFLTNYGVVAEGEWNGKEWLQYRWGCGIDDSAVTCWMELSALKKQCNPTDEDMKEALRTEYEKGRADTIAEIQKKWDDCRRRKDIISFLESLRLKED